MTIATHSRALFATPFHWPMAGFTLDGDPGVTAGVWLPNLAGIPALLSGRWLRRGLRQPIRTTVDTGVEG